MFRRKKENVEPKEMVIVDRKTGKQYTKEEFAKMIVEETLKNNDDSVNVQNETIMADEDMKPGIVYEPACVSILGGPYNEKVEYDNSTRTMFLNEQLANISYSLVCIDRGINKSIAGYAYNTSLDAMINMMVENHINEVFFMLDQLKDRVNETVYSIFKLKPYSKDRDLEEECGAIQPMFNPRAALYGALNYDYKYSITNMMNIILSMPEEEKRRNNFENGLPIGVAALVDSIGVQAWTLIERYVFNVAVYTGSNDPIPTAMSYLNAEIAAFMAGMFLSTDRLVYNLTIPAAIGKPEAEGNLEIAPRNKLDYIYEDED